MQEKGFWDDIKRAEEVTKESKSIKDKIERYEALVNRLDDVEVLAELAEDDEETINEVITEIRDIEKLIEEYKIELLLSGEYDKNDAILNLHAGVGGSDANDWTLMLLRMYTRWCEKKGYKVETLDILEGDEAGIKSATLRVKGEFAYGYLKAEKPTQSPRDPPAPILRKKTEWRTVPGQKPKQDGKPTSPAPAVLFGSHFSFEEKWDKTERKESAPIGQKRPSPPKRQT